MSWKDRPTILNKVNKDKNYVFSDESGHILGLRKLNNKIVNFLDVNIRDESIFMINSILVKGSNEVIAKRFINKIKFNYFNDVNIILRSTDIHCKKREFSFMKKDTVRGIEFGNDLTEYLQKTCFNQVCTAIDKINLLKNNGNIVNEHDEMSVIKHVYTAQIIKIAKMLAEEKTEAILVFEAVDKKFDKIILDIVKNIKKMGTAKHSRKFFNCIRAVYFTEKKSESYSPFGEIADLSSRPVYKHYLNIEYQILKPKLFMYPYHEGNGISLIKESSFNNTQLSLDI